MGGIYSLPTTSSRWLISIGDGRTGQSLCTVRCAPRQRNHWDLEQLTAGDVCLLAALDSPVPSEFCALTSDMHCSSRQATVGAQRAVAPLAHRTVR
jgi:hypothetical protein